MNEPRQPADPPVEGTTPSPHPDSPAPHGVPDGIEEGEAKGLPHSDREKNEQAVSNPS